MSQHPTGVHHIAMMAGDIKKHIAFFSEVVGFPLVALFDMHGVEGGLPAVRTLRDLSIITVSAFACCTLAALIPALIAAFLQPAKALRSQ